MTEGEAAVAKATRTLWVTQVCRWLIGTAFLFQAFIDFPDHKWAIGLGVVVLEFGLMAVMDLITQFRVHEIYVSSTAQMKALHTILASAEWGEPYSRNCIDFWHQVNEAVRAETAQVEKPTWLAAAGLMSASMLYRISATVSGIAIIAALTP